MCERKSWTKMEDRTLKLLYEQRGYKKWSDVAEIMRSQYGILGRNGKQCRERYHNHLDQKISKAQWTSQEDQALLKLHNQLGNRWALIARQIKGRTDNCVKNRFYSRFRRSLKNVNELIKIFWKKKFKQLKPNFISKVIQITEQYRRTQDPNKKVIFETCEDLKCRLISYSETKENQLKENKQSLENLFNLIKQINQFNRKNKRRGKKRKIEESQCDEDLQYINEAPLDQKIITKNKCSASQAKLQQKPRVQFFQFVQQNINENNCEQEKNPVMQKSSDIKSLRVSQNQGELNQQEAFEAIKLEIDKEQFYENKKFQTEAYIGEKIEDGIDIYEFYNMENISFGRQMYFY